MTNALAGTLNVSKHFLMQAVRFTPVTRTLCGCKPYAYNLSCLKCLDLMAEVLGPIDRSAWTLTKGLTVT